MNLNRFRRQGGTAWAFSRNHCENLSSSSADRGATAIAAFLDRETAKIDLLVEEQQRLIALLKEKRQAVISHAVTKGLDPNAPMKDSGVEWLGEMPAHWLVSRIRRIAKAVQTGGTPARAPNGGREDGVPGYPGDFGWN